MVKKKKPNKLSSSEPYLSPPKKLSDKKQAPKRAKYHEGPEAARNFQGAVKSLFKAGKVKDDGDKSQRS